jgi:hypothetical protein
MIEKTNARCFKIIIIEDNSADVFLIKEYLEEFKNKFIIKNFDTLKKVLKIF